MKYLFAAIDARQGRVQHHPHSHRHGSHAGHGRPKYNAAELKKLLLDASEGVDEKTSTHDFVDTLERIVNEIKNDTLHSAAFLTKVKKTDVPDYYDVIKKPMDLATLLKRVKQQTYRTKKSFADDLDLIWSNCLLYNSHPAHPLRQSAEYLRQKSNTLLEFISDPALPTRSLYVQAVQHSDRRKGGTPTPGPEDDGEGASGSDEDGEGGHTGMTRGTGGRFKKKVFGVGLNGDSHEDTASPGGSRASTPLQDRLLHRKHGRGPLGRTASPSPPPPQLAFEDRPAVLRTPQSMMDFTVLDVELNRLEESLGIPPVASTSALGILPPPAPPVSPPPPPPTTNGAQPSTSTPTSLAPPDPITTAGTPTSTAVTPAPASPAPPPATPHQTRLTNLIKSLAESGPEPTTMGPPTKELPPDAVWWRTMGAGGSQCVVSGIPGTGFVQGLPVDGAAAGEVVETVKANGVMKGKEIAKKLEAGRKVGSAHPADVVRSKSTKKGKAVMANGIVDTAPDAQEVEGKKSSLKAGGTATATKSKRKARKPAGVGLPQRMQRNVETLKEIRKLHYQLSNGDRSVDGLDPSLVPLSDFDSESEAEGNVKAVGRPLKKRPRSYLDTGVSPAAFKTTAAPQAARESMMVVSNRVLSHTGFDGAASTAVGVLAHVAAEYIMNLGRTIRHLSDRFGGHMSSEEILLHVLGENGVAAPAELEAYVKEDIVAHGDKLGDLLTKLKRSRQTQIDAYTGPVAGDEEIFGQGENVFVLGEVNRKLGEDFFGLSDMGMEREAALAATLPMRLLRGDPRDPDDRATVAKYPSPPPHIPLTPAAIEAQIGLLQPFYLLRQKTEAGLIDDFEQDPRVKSMRNKVPVTGRIPVKMAAKKRKVEEPPVPAVVIPKKKKILEVIESEG